MKARHLDSVCIVGPDDRARNMATSLGRGYPVCIPIDAHDRPLVVVGSGPSVRDYLDAIRSAKEVWAINGAYDYLVGMGVVPTGFFALDPLPGLVDYIRHPRKETIYYLASTVDLSVLDALDGYDVRIWHTNAEDMTYPSGAWSMRGGTTAITRAPYLGYCLGYRDITIYGADSSFNGNRYCYEDGQYPCDSEAPRMKFMCNGEGPFETELCLLKQVSQLGVIIGIFNGMLKIKSGGLVDAFLRSPVMDDSDIELEP